jgi:hypothetical protein
LLNTSSGRPVFILLTAFFLQLFSFTFLPAVRMLVF